jgi:hypothetical protein
MGALRIELTSWESTELLRTRTIGRICVIEHGYPLAIPINYQVVGSQDDVRIVLRTAPDTILGRYQGLASLEVDDVALDDGTAWSVIVRGEIRRVIGGHDLPDPDPLLSEGRQQWLTLMQSSISGRRFHVTKAADGSSADWQLASA